MVRVMVPPLATVVAGVNTRTGATAMPETSVGNRVMDAKPVIAVVIARALTPVVKTVSALDDILKPAVAAA